MHHAPRRRLNPLQRLHRAIPGREHPRGVLSPKPERGAVAPEHPLERVELGERAVELVALFALGGEDEAAPGAAAAAAAHPLDHPGDGHAVEEHNEVDFGHVEPLLSDAGGDESVELAAAKRRHHRLLLLLRLPAGVVFALGFVRRLALPDKLGRDHTAGTQS